MGWLKWSCKEPSLLALASEDSNSKRSQPAHYKDITGHIERLDLNLNQATIETPSFERRYPFHPAATTDAELPFISRGIIQSSKHHYLWLVVDDIVYDCTGFEHPGGATVIESFRGENCSWQFWRFHNKKHMREYGRPLRIGRTSGVPNRFEERPRFVGLSKLGASDW